MARKNEDDDDRYRPPRKPPNLLWIGRLDQPVRRYSWVAYSRQDVAQLMTGKLKIHQYVNLEMVERLINRAIKVWGDSHNGVVSSSLNQLKADIRHEMKGNQESK